MIVINNSNNEETPHQFEHSNVIMAFAEVVASNTHKRTILMLDEEGFINAHVSGQIVMSDSSYELGELSIPFNSIADKKSVVH